MVWRLYYAVWLAWTERPDDSYYKLYYAVWLARREGPGDGLETVLCCMASWEGRN